jgi:hypothetical protein
MHPRSVARTVARAAVVSVVAATVLMGSAASAFACGGLIAPNGTISLRRTPTLAAYCRGASSHPTRSATPAGWTGRRHCTDHALGGAGPRSSRAATGPCAWRSRFSCPFGPQFAAAGAPSPRGCRGLDARQGRFLDITVRLEARSRSATGRASTDSPAAGRASAVFYAAARSHATGSKAEALAARGSRRAGHTGDG